VRAGHFTLREFVTEKRSFDDYLEGHETANSKRETRQTIEQEDARILGESTEKGRACVSNSK
jgi:hypothetical protein